MIDFQRLQQVSLLMLFAVFFLCLHFLMRLGIMLSLDTVSVCNSAGAFGVALPQWFILDFSFFFLFSLFLFLIQKKHLFSFWPWIIIFSAGLGNFLERVFFGCIIDYIRLPYLPLFNVADMLISFCALILVSSFLYSSVFDQK